ncbi:nucleotidyltransferase domain-containing protein [Neobacillus sp. YIM B02564]|uniref:Nucleotidyltransferase domain-containing protein n=1 Tax=Neobacillus paridis TaxID=2803862 RepID=A0ABS1TQ65_9BACI|nr:nucleotidyltransferase domain-containing protein [Neobacillus paridis]MBL4953476.1 nucleotidyltransferase domain-containing protein [Neobacillus paridis]
MFGLLERDLEFLLKAFSSFKEVEKAVLFGSRAMGNYKKGSDVDIAIIGEDVTRKTLYGLYDLLNEEYPLPYFFDILIYDEISNPKLREHIESVGQVIYQRKE